jgi:hypothetical protein
VSVSASRRVFESMTIMWIIMVLVVVIGIPFTLWWWKQADRWADAEHRRFRVKSDEREKVVVKRQERP